MVRKNIELYRESLRAAGHDPATREVAGVYQMYCGDSRAEALEHGGAYALQYYKFFEGLDRRLQHTSATYERYKRGLSFSTFSYDDLDEMRVLLIGDPATLIERIRWTAEFYGATYLILEVAQGGEPHEYVMRSLERFARQVMPVFKENQA
jgi:alkanesulfonate monooxygenase SsuD/methylene tetrahydromethanopterin reductase-like flavin-dependent oxidoreductase (luciferase family)